MVIFKDIFAHSNGKTHKRILRGRVAPIAGLEFVEAVVMQRLGITHFKPSQSDILHWRARRQARQFP